MGPHLGISDIAYNSANSSEVRKKKCNFYTCTRFLKCA